MTSEKCVRVRTQEEEEEECTYTYIHTHTFPKPRTTFYVPQAYIQTFIELDKILRRENKSLSEWIRNHAVDYVRLHSPGNPQQRIDTVLKTGKPYRAVERCRCGVAATRKVSLEDGETVFCCSLHMPNNVKSYKELRRSGS